MKRSIDDCPACFVKNCECECKTCEESRIKYKEFSQAKLDDMNILELLHNAKPRNKV